MRQLNSKPFFRGKKQAYYCWIDGHLKSLGKKKQAAWAKYRELIADRENLGQSKPWTVREVFDYYLEHAATLKPNTYRNRFQTFDRLCKEAKVGRLPWHDLTSDHLEAWARTHPDWSASMRRSVMNYVVTAYNHALSRKKISDNPIKLVKKPAWERREHVLSPEDQQTILDAATGPFRDILIALNETGARPAELCSACVEHLTDGVIVLDVHKEDERGEPRLIYLSPAARELVERLCGQRESGFIFRNSRGDAWTPDTIFCRFKRLRKKLGIHDGVFPYASRSRYITDALEKGIDPITVSELVGHKTLDMVKRHYARLGKSHLKDAAEQATKKDSK